MLKKQKQLVRRMSLLSPQQQQLLKQYRTAIVPQEFSVKEVETFNCLSSGDLQNIEISTIQVETLKEFVVDALKLSFIYDPLKEVLHLSTPKYINYYQLKLIIRILFRGQFYRFLRNTENQLKILVNNRTTEANLKILIAALLIQGARKLNIEQISTCLLFFELEAGLNPTDDLSIPAESQKICKILKKIERVVKPAEFKIWFEAVKNHKDFKGQIQAHHFLYLCSMSEKKFAQTFNYVTLQPKIASLFKNLNINGKMPDFQQKSPDQTQEKMNNVKGLSFVEPKPRQSFSFFKEILKEFRIRDPSKNKRPDTGNLRSRVQSFCNIPASRVRHPSNVEQNQSASKSHTSNSLSKTLTFSKHKRSNAELVKNFQTKIAKRPSKGKKKEFKLKLHW